jgi:hypothetical protein
MTELEYVIKHGGLTPKRLLKKINRREFGVSVLGGLAAVAASPLISGQPIKAQGADFTIAIIPDPQWLAESCPDNLGEYYAAMMTWIVDHRNTTFTSSQPSFNANIKAVIGVGDCVNLTAGANQFKNAEAAWTILDRNGVAFTTPPGNHDYIGNSPYTRSNLGAQFATGYFSAVNRSSAYGSGISLGHGDMAYWIGSHDTTGANTAVKFVISGIEMLILAMDFFAGNAAWSWAYDVMLANPNCECYITTHAWLTRYGTRFQRADTYGPDAFSMAASPYSNSAGEAWNTVGVNAWSNLCGIFSGHDIHGGNILGTAADVLPEWFYQHVPVTSSSSRGQSVHQLFANSQDLDRGCSMSASKTTGAGQIASVFLLSHRLELGLLEGRMISTQSGDWFGPNGPAVAGGDRWSASETLLFSVPFTGLQRPIPEPVQSPWEGNRPVRSRSFYD